MSYEQIEDQNKDFSYQPDEKQKFRAIIITYIEDNWKTLNRDKSIKIQIMKELGINIEIWMSILDYIVIFLPLYKAD